MAAPFERGLQLDHAVAYLDSTSGSALPAFNSIAVAYTVDPVPVNPAPLLEAEQLARAAKAVPSHVAGETIWLTGTRTDPA